MNRRTFLGASLAAPAALCRCSLHCEPVVAPNPIGGCVGGHHFENWAETISCRPSSYCQPESVDQLSQIVKSAAAAGKKVRTVGAGHSWAPLVLTSDILVNLDRMQSVLSVDPATKRVTVQAGIRLRTLLDRLDETTPRLAPKNLGSITEQSVAGATATGTHGTGITLQNLSAMIVGAKVVVGNGDVVEIDDEARLRAIRVSLGALGILSEVTLQLVDHYDLTSTAYWAAFDDVVDNLDDLVKRNTRLRLWWIVWKLGCREQVIVTTMNPEGSWVPEAGALPGKVRKETLPAQSKDLLKRRVTTSVKFQKFNETRQSYRQAFHVPLLKVTHRECEYAIPAEKAAEALRACKKFFDEGDVSLKMPVEVRWVAKDDSLLSPARGQDVCYIGISTEDNALEVFQRFEPMMRQLGGRPHWGKFYALNRWQTRDLYSDSFDEFVALKNKLDPKGVFANELIERLFG